LPTDKGFTGQRLDATGLMFYNARYYDSAIGRFISADTTGPDAGNPQVLNRYAYTGNNPLKYTDPSGHCFDPISCGALLGAVVGLGLYTWNVSQSHQQWNLGDALTVSVVGAGAGALIGTGVGAVVGTAAFAAIATSAGVGMATGGGGYLAVNGYLKQDFDSKDFIIASTVGGAAGAVGQAGAATTLPGAIALGGGASVIQYGASRLAHNQLPTLQGIAWAGGTGMAGGAVGGSYTPIDDFTRSGVSQIGFDLSNPEFRGELQQDLLAKVIGGTGRSAAATVITGLPEPKPKAPRRLNLRVE